MMYDVPGQSPDVEITLYLMLGQSGYIKIGAYVSLFFNASNNYRLHRHGKQRAGKKYGEILPSN